jgi:alkanesulfonate monooxygenase SsuD/methylene tetrahydromethanopterin reductase-like flavin-dependent oxidoreductase (luciferase family)
MEYAILLESQEGLTWPQVFAAADRAEAVGLEALYLSDHFAPVDVTSGRAVMPAWPAVAVLAARTSRLRVGPLVSPVTFRHPADLAKSVVALEWLTQGRIDLGVGAAWHEAEHRMFGFDFPAPRIRVDRLQEALEILAALWDGEVHSYQGTHFQLNEARLVPAPVSSRPPVILGGAGDRMLNLAARFAQEWNCFYKGADEYAQLRERFLQACSAQGRAPETIRRSLMTPLLLGRNEADVELRLAAHRRVFPGLPESIAAWRASGMPGGTISEFREQVQLWSQMGVQRIIFEHNDVDDLAVLELLAEV